jgi:hypothetical protein
VKDLRQFMLVLMMLALLSGPAAPPAAIARRIDLRLFLAGRAEAAIPPNTGYTGVKVVDLGGSGNYTAIGDALNHITDNDATHRYLVWVAPGLYTDTFPMKSYVDIMGSGEGMTIVSQVGSSSATTGTIKTASNATLSFLTVQNTGGKRCTGVYDGNYNFSTSYTCP